MVCVLSSTNVSEKIMLKQLNKIIDQMEIMIGAMHESNELMKKLTDQLEIISLPPDMVKWAQEKQN